VAHLIFIFFLAGWYFPMLYILPIQFQSIDKDSASHSGVRLISLILGISIFAMVSNTLISAFRRHLPLLVLGAVAGAVGATMIYTLDADTSMAKWTGY
jgi:Na+/citrate or Na+/malate symporter